MLHQIRNHIDACELAFRIVCGSSPHGPPPHSSLHTYVGAVYALDPATRLDQENAPTECELKAHEMKRRKVAALDPGCNAAVTSPSKREAAYDAKIDGWMREILAIARAPVHRAASAEESERVAERERTVDAQEQELAVEKQQLVVMQQQLADKLAEFDARLAKMEEPSTGQLESTAAQEEVAEEKVIANYLIVCAVRVDCALYLPFDCPIREYLSQIGRFAILDSARERKFKKRVYSYLSNTYAHGRRAYARRRRRTQSKVNIITRPRTFQTRRIVRARHQYGVKCPFWRVAHLDL